MPPAKKPKKKSGRRAMPESERKGQAFPLKLSKDDVRLVKAAAALDKDKPYNWARRMLLIAAEKRMRDEERSSEASEK